MPLLMSASDYVDYLERVYRKIDANNEYVTRLDSETGDGDHCTNLIMGYKKLLVQKDSLSGMNLSDLFKTCGMVFMSAVGGSSGILYGSAYLAASRVLVDKEIIDLPALEAMLKAELDAIMKRGNAQPGFKTMIDPLYRAHEKLEKALGQNEAESTAVIAMREGAKEGMLATKDMEAVRGRACYQADKGVGHLDPGAVTMFYQLETLAECLLKEEA